jgi:RimJ/RimL family protein N-acetyltransferase
MISELRPPDYERVRPLLQPLRYHLTSAAVLNGNSPGRVLVDDPGRPRSAFVLSPEGCYLVGAPHNGPFNRSLNEAIVRERALGDDVRVLFLVTHPEGWRRRLSAILDPLPIVEERRRHYVCRTLRRDVPASPPEGYVVRRIDRSLLEDAGVTVPSHVMGWMENNWGSIEHFLERGFGFAAVHGREVASWSLADCVSGDGCEIGIRTAPVHRRRGLAAVTAAAAVEHALSRGFAMVGWHCPEDNLGSIRTAQKVGFRRERDYVAHYARLDR